MSKELYYSEMAAFISALLHKEPVDLERFNKPVDIEGEKTRHSWTLCAEAAKVFDTMEGFSKDYFIDTYKALEYLANDLRRNLQNGHKPDILDLCQIASDSIEKSL